MTDEQERHAARMRLRAAARLANVIKRMPAATADQRLKKAQASRELHEQVLADRRKLGLYRPRRGQSRAMLEDLPAISLR